MTANQLGCTRAMVKPYFFKNEMGPVKNTYELTIRGILAPI